MTAELTSGLEEVARARLDKEGGEVMMMMMIMMMMMMMMMTGIYQQVDWRGILSKCSHLFPELFGNQQQQLEYKHGQQLEYKPDEGERKNIVEEEEEEKRPHWSRTPENEEERCENEKVEEVSTAIAILSEGGGEGEGYGGEERSVVQLDAGNAQPGENEGALSKVREQPSHANLDFSQIQEELEGHQTRRKLLLLQALRWMLTRSPVTGRVQIIATFATNDLLGLRSSDRLLTWFLPSGSNIPHLLQGSLARLVNAMASGRSGREYLVQHRRLLETLIDCLVFIGGQMAAVTVDMIVAVLQKLSLKYSARKMMLQRGLVSWLVTCHLVHLEPVRLYGLEYSTALLMNLCLHRSGKEQCVPLANSVLNLLLELLVRDLKPINPYVNGTLYSLLGNREINVAARSLGVEQRIISKCQNCEEETRRQLEYILDQLRGEDTGEDPGVVSEEEEEGGEADEVEEVVDIEEEIDEDDPVVARRDELAGLQLLQQRYLRPQPTISLVSLQL